MPQLSSPLTLSLAALACSLSFSCASGDEPPPNLAIGQKVPFPTAEWSVRSPEEMGMDSAVLDGARAYAFDFDADQDGVPDTNTQGVVVVRGGAIVGEWYAPGKDRSSYAASWSMAKSFVSTLVGIAIDRGLIPSVDVPMSAFFPEWAGTSKGAITLRQVLQMQSGLDFVEDYTNGDVILMSVASDALTFARNLGVKVPPDTRWYYSSADSELLGGVVEAATGKNPTDFGRENLFAPIGMNPADWWIDGANHTFSYCCLDTPTRDFAKFGLLFLREGSWDGNQVVSRDWVHRATETLASLNPGYAYQWWTSGAIKALGIRDLYFADGLDEQKIFVIPSLDLVVAKNTLYTKPPGAAVAPDGWVAHFTPRGISQYGTKAPLIWEDAAFLAPIINSIKGGPRIDFTPTHIGGSPNDPALCRVQAQSFGTYCEAVHGCVCDHCATQFLDCNKVEACAAVARCAFEKACRGIDCLTPCSDVINAYGGASTGNVGITLALRLSECSNACPLTCP